MKKLHLQKEEEELKIANIHEINIKLIEVLAGDSSGSSAEIKIIKQYKNISINYYNVIRNSE